MKHLYFIAASILLLAGTASAQSTYKITRKFALEGEGGWDYITADTVQQRLFVSHGTVVQVVDINSGNLLGTIADTKGVHGIALAQDLHKGFSSNGKDTSVTVFDLQSLKTLAKVKIPGLNPDAILYDPFSKKVFVFNGRSANATVLDAATNAVIGTVALSGKPEFAVTDLHGKIYVNIEDKSQLSVINSTALKVENTWSVSPGEEPSGLALDNIHHILFSVCGNKQMVILDALSGKVLKTVPIGDHTDGVAFDPSTLLAFSSNGEGNVTVVREKSPTEFEVAETVQTLPRARTICVNPGTHKLYLPTIEGGADKSAKGQFTVIELAR